MWRPPQWQIRKVRDRTVGAPSRHQLRSNMATKHRYDLEVDKCRRDERLVNQPLPGATAIRRVVAQGHSQYTGVNDDHVLPERDSRPS